MTVKLIASIFFLFMFWSHSSQAAEDSLKQIPPKKVEMDTNYDGKVDRVEHYNAEGIVVRLETDTNGDGIMDEWIVFENGSPVKKEKDTNNDGAPDVWVEY